MPRKGKSVVRKAGGAIAQTARKLTTKLNPRKRSAEQEKKAPEHKSRNQDANRPEARGKQRTHRRPARSDRRVLAEADRLKSSFRSDGADQQLDQEMPIGAADRWQDEDHFTNKSGDARIGTHGRSYEPGEMRPGATR